MTQKILITGRTGFLGNITYNNLKSNEYEKFSLSTRKSEYNVDLANEIPEFKVGFDIVFHAAGKAHSTPSTREDAQQFFEVNLTGTKNLIKGLENSGELPQSIIYVSSVSVYGLDKGEELDEETPLKAKTPYAQSKLKAEEFLLNWGKDHGVTIGIIRLPLIAGPNPPGNLGAMIAAIKNGKYYRIRNNESLRSMVSAEDIVKTIEPLSEKGGIYNLSDGYHPSIREIEDVISEKVGKPINEIPFLAAKFAAFAGDIIGKKIPINSTRLRKLTSTLTFSDEKARRELRWSPTPALSYLKKVL